MPSPFICKALLQEAVDGKVRCLSCERRCLLAEGQVGWCGTRQNWGGTLYTLTYGLVSSLSCNPIEKKPLYHFYLGSVALTAGFWSCRFAWPWCQAQTELTSPEVPARGDALEWSSSGGRGEWSQLHRSHVGPFAEDVMQLSVRLPQSERTGG